MGPLGMQIMMLVIFIGAMYFLLIRPQKKKEKSINDMRNSIQVGDEIVTIGGICGKVVKTKDESIVIQVGADKVKFEMMRWSISSVTSKSNKAAEKEEPKKPAKPKKLTKAEKAEEEVKEAPATPAEEAPKAEEPAKAEEAANEEK